LVGTGNASDYFNQQGDTTGETNPLLGPLTYNGGPTKTHALLVGSPAINAGNPMAVAGAGGVPLFDQRGALFSRVSPSGGRIDIGAFEWRPIVLGDFNGDGVVNALDIDLLAAAAHNSPHNLFYDLNGSGQVTYAVGSPGAVSSDSDVLVRQLVDIFDSQGNKVRNGTEYGDLNLDGQVFLSDLITFATNYRQPNPLFGWAHGNIDGRQDAGTPTAPRVFLSDLIALATHWRFGVATGSASAAAVPEPDAASATAAARATSIAVTETPADWQVVGSRSRRAFDPSRRAGLGGDDLLLLALDRLGRTTQQMVTSTAKTSERHRDDGSTESLIDEPLAVALATW
jgi:hypothetical protein